MARLHGVGCVMCSHGMPCPVAVLPLIMSHILSPHVKPAAAHCTADFRRTCAQYIKEVFSMPKSIIDAEVSKKCAQEQVRGAGWAEVGEYQTQVHHRAVADRPGHRLHKAAAG